MKKYIIPILIVLITLSNNDTFANNGIAIFGGLSTPNDKMSSVYNSDKIFSNTLNQNVDLLKDAAALGYHIGAKIILPLSSDFVLHGGFAWNRFPQNKVAVKDNSGNQVAELEVSQDLFPISAGLDYYFINSAIGAYLLGELTYNYNKNTVNYMYSGVGMPLDLKISDQNPGYSRIGAGIGAGIEFNIIITTLLLEAKYNFMNIIAKDEGEPIKSYFTLSLGVKFGGMPKSN